MFRSFARADLAVYAAMASIKAVIHLATAGRYGLFRDEYYYLACASRLDWGYVDHPPLSIWILAATRALLGDGVVAIRLPAIVAAVGVVVGTGLVVRRLGGDRFGQAVAMASVIACPMLLGVHSYYSMNSFDHLFWVIGAYLLVRLIQEERGTWWIAIGVLCGIGLMNKTSVAFFGIGLVGAVVLSPLRRWLATPWPWTGAAVALLLYAPNLVWQMTHQWAMFEFMRNAALYKNVAMGPAAFLVEVIKSFHPLLLPVWAAGVLYPFLDPAARRWRPLAILFVVVLAVFIVGNGKPYYVAAAFPIAFALGSAWMAKLSEGLRRTRIAIVVAIAVGGLAMLPMAVPVLPPATALAYMQSLGLVPKPAERSHAGAMPQHFADRFGWRERARLVRRAYMTLSPEERAQAVVIGLNYGEAASVEYYADELELPPGISPHNNYWLWGPGRAGRAVNILISRPDHPVLQWFESAEDFGIVDEPFQLDGWRQLHVYVVRGLKRPIAEVWIDAKSYM